MRSRFTRFAPLALILFAASLPLGCGSDGGGGPTTPPPPGLTLAFTFPDNGTSRLHTFTAAGVFDYRCGPHGSAGMTGRVTVDAGSANDSVVVNVGVGGNVFSPSNVTIKVGGYVRWIKPSGASNHTVTYP